MLGPSSGEDGTNKVKTIVVFVEVDSCDRK